MNSRHLIFLSVPGLRVRDVTRERTPTLFDWANRGVIAELTPTFPCVTSSVQASMWTGVGPDRHGVIANGFYHRNRREVEFWVARNDVIGGEQIWDAIKAKRPAFTSAVWHAQNIKDAAADYIVTPAPIHEPDGSTKLWCYSKPDGFYQELLDEFGHFPLQHYWGPLANIESTRWILAAAHRLIAHHAPNFHWIYLPHLDYAAQKHGPDSVEARNALAELDALLGEFRDQVERAAAGSKPAYLIAGEYALTDVNAPLYPNRTLRDAGLLAVRGEDGGELIDFETSEAFAMVDHQLAHIYVNSESAEARERVAAGVVELFDGTPGLSGVYAGHSRDEFGIDHDRAGDVVLVTDDAHWLAYYWWTDDDNAPRFARTVDIHRKPGYDPVELFIDPSTRGIPLDATLVRGSHGAPATKAKHRTALICTTPTNTFHPGGTYRDTDMKRLSIELLGLA